MNAEDVFSLLKVPQASLSALGATWEQAMKDYPAEGAGWMRPETVSELAAYCSLDEKSSGRMVEFARENISDEAFRRFAWLCHWKLLKDLQGDMNGWPDENSMPGVGLYYLLAALSLIPEIRRVHAAMGIDGQVTRDTTLEISCFNNNHIVGHDVPGIIRGQLFWLRNYPQAKLFRLGRMEYMLKAVDGMGVALKNRSSGAVVLLAPDGVRFDSKGYVDGVGGKFDDNGWKSSYKFEDGKHAGYPVAPEGFALDKAVELHESQWEVVFRDGDMAVDMHIPSGGNMAPELCIDSMRKAFDFFQRHFPGNDLRAMICKSWIFNTQIEERLPDSNLSKFMRELYLFPIPSAGNDGFFFIFLKDYPDLSKAPRKTSLQKMMLDILESGGKLRSSGMFFLRDDLGRFGTQRYRNSFRP